MRSCLVCGGPVGLGGARGRIPTYCGDRCRMRASRARRRMPAELTTGRRWVRADGKRPIRVDGSPASSTDPQTWSTYAEAKASIAGAGIGVMLGDGLGCYDLDHVSDSEARAFAATIPERIVYAERSMSGAGVHVFVEAPESKGWKRTVGRIS